jgi:GT2 family glycosyltransferase
MKFSVIIVNDGNPARALAAIAAQTQRDFEVLVVGAKTPLPDDRFKHLDGDISNPIAAKNMAAQAAKGEWLFFINTTTYLADDCLESLYAASLRFPDCAMFACTQLEDENTGMIAAAGKCYFAAGMPYCGGKNWPIDVLPDEGEAFGACTPAMLIKKAVFEQVGGFDADYVMALEDADISLRLRLVGHTAMLASEAMVFVGIEPNKKDIHAYAIRNIAWTFIKNMPGFFFWPLLPLHIFIHLVLLCNPLHFMARINGLLMVLETLPAVWKKRVAIQAARTVNLDTLANAFTWNVYSVFWNKPDIRRKR